MTVLTFADPAEPTVSVVSVVYGGRPMLAEMLASLAATVHSAVEVIVVDNDSPDDSAEWVRRSTSGVRLVQAGANLGFGQGMNLGVRHARADLVVLANTDLVFQPGWLEPIERAARRWGAAVPVSVDAGGVDVERGGVVSADGHAHLVGPQSPILGGEHARAVSHASAACLAIDRTSFLDAGGFDPRFGLGYHEDVDLFAVLAVDGVRPMWCPTSTVTHEGGGSFGSALASALASRNHPRNLRRWRWARTRRTWPADFDEPGALDAGTNGRVVVRFGSRSLASPVEGDPLSASVEWLTDHAVAVRFVVDDDNADADARSLWRVRGVELTATDAGASDLALDVGRVEAMVDIAQEWTDLLVARGVAPIRSRPPSPHQVVTSGTAVRW